MLTYGIIELRRGNNPKAVEFADKMLELSPLDPNAIFLKSQALLFSGRPLDAEALLEDQLRKKPQDPTALRSLSLLYRLREDWPALATILQRRLTQDPANFESGLEFVEAALLASRTADARAASHIMLKTDLTPRKTRAILDLWARRPSGHKVLDTRGLAARASPENKIVYATFLNRIGAPKEALALLPHASEAPLKRDNLGLHAAHARSLALLGRTEQAKKKYDAILKLDGQHADALEGRADLEIRAGAGLAAVYDAQQLIASRPTSGEARLLLARAYATARDRRMMERALWTAFRDLPANSEVYQALHRYIASSSGPEAARQVEKEYEAQRKAKFMRELM
jgi:tetratricopeptide (TPR) repeat protein